MITLFNYPCSAAFVWPLLSGCPCLAATVWPHLFNCLRLAVSVWLPLFSCLLSAATVWCPAYQPIPNSPIAFSHRRGQILKLCVSASGILRKNLSIMCSSEWFILTIGSVMEFFQKINTQNCNICPGGQIVQEAGKQQTYRTRQQTYCIRLHKPYIIVMI